MDAPLGLTHFWDQADTVGRTVAWLLLAMSVASWAVIIGKLRRAWALRQAAATIAAYWEAPNAETALAQLRARDAGGLMVRLAEAVAVDAALIETTAASTDAMTARQDRQLRAALRAAQQKLDSGLTLLASVGTTAPFVGLLGTVWGIYNALLGIATAGQLSIAKVAGPVGEALIMTAAGLAVAIPAVLAYNAYSRANRAVLAELDGFARDLHARATAHEA